MGVRETISKNSTLVTAVAAVFLMLVLGTLAWQLWYADTGPSVGGDAGQRYFTVDDGKTYFADAATRYPPFEQDGKPAVQAMVYKDLDTGDVFVGYLMRYTPEGKKALEAADKMPPAARRNAGEGSVVENEVKKPLTGAAGWVRSSDALATAVFNVTGPKGGSNIEPVVP